MSRIGVEILASVAIFQCSDHAIMWIKEVFQFYMYNYVMLKDAATYFEAQQQFLKQVYPLILKCMSVYIALTLSATNVTVMGSIIYQGLP